MNSDLQRKYDGSSELQGVEEFLVHKRTQERSGMNGCLEVREVSEHSRSPECLAHKARGKK